MILKNKISIDTFSLWTLVRDAFNPRHESIKFGKKLEDKDSESKKKDRVVLSVPPTEVLDKTGKNDWPPALREDFDLEAEAAKDHNKDWPPFRDSLKGFVCLFSFFFFFLQRNRHG